MTGVLDVSSASSLHQMPESKLTWSRGLPVCAAALPIASPLASHWLGCTEVLEGLQKCLQTMCCILIDLGEERKVEILP